MSVLEETRPCDITTRFVSRCRRLFGASTAAPVRAVARASRDTADDDEERVEQEWKSVEMGGLGSTDTPVTPSPTSDSEAALTAGSASDEPWVGEGAGEGAEPSPYGPSRTMCQVLGDRPVLLACLNYGLLAFVYIVFDESLPLFLKAGKERGAPRRAARACSGRPDRPLLYADPGGLGFRSSNIGITLGVGGIASALFVYFVAPRLVHGIGPLRAFRSVGRGRPVASAGRGEPAPHVRAWTPTRSLPRSAASAWPSAQAYSRYFPSYPCSWAQPQPYGPSPARCVPRCARPRPQSAPSPAHALAPASSWPASCAWAASPSLPV